MYLSSRDPLVLNYNPFMAFKDDKRTKDQVSWNATKKPCSLHHFPSSSFILPLLPFSHLPCLPTPFSSFTYPPSLSILLLYPLSSSFPYLFFPHPPSSSFTILLIFPPPSLSLLFLPSALLLSLPPLKADRAANFIRSAVRFRASLLDNKLEPEIYHLNPERSDTQRFRSIIRCLCERYHCSLLQSPVYSKALFTAGLLTLTDIHVHTYTHAHTPQIHRFVPSTFSWYGAYLVKAFPLDMSQYSRLFNSTRIPQPHSDELVSLGNQRHVVVMRNGHFYIFNAVQPNGQYLYG